MTSLASTQADDQPRVGGGRDGQGARRNRTTGRVSQKSLCLSLGARPARFSSCLAAGLDDKRPPYYLLEHNDLHSAKVG